MADMTSGCFGSQSQSGFGKDSVYVDVSRILDSCRDKDCYENTRVYLTSFGQEVIERCGSIRVKSAQIAGTNICVNPITFNKGFYQITIKIYVKIVLEACVCLGNSQEIEGVCVCEKNVVLYGSEGSVNIFRSDNCPNCFCRAPSLASKAQNNLPVAVLEVAEPVVLDAKIVDKCDCQKCCDCQNCIDLPEEILDCISGKLCDCEGNKILTVSLGFFSVVRIERPGQYLVSGTPYSVPDKECLPSDDETPCEIFKNMSFPTDEFYPPAYGCGCNNQR